MKKTTGFLLILLVGSVVAMGADSPQFRGPDRDGKFADTGLLKAWPEGGPALLWKSDGIGAGYASASVVGDTIYVPGMLDDNQGYVFALDLSGKLKWKSPYGTETLDKQAAGSRTTPTIDGDRLYVISGLGVLTCMSTADGKPIWQVDTKTKFGGQDVSWSIAESVLVDGDLVFCTPGGQDASVVALNKMTGDTVWTTKGFSEPHAYCAPDVFQFDGRRVLVTMTAKSVIGVDTKDGKVLWTHKHETDYDIHAVTPVLQGNMLYYTAGYGSGGGMLEVSKDGASVTPKWSDKNLDCQHHGVVLLDGYIYGAGHNNGKLFCIELATGTVKWSADEISQAVVEYADGMLYTYEGPKKGIMSLVKASPEKFEKTGTFVVAKGRDKHWAHPTIAGGRLYVRYDGSLYAYDIKAK
ncbi:MAG: PQQ-like beta-propeller repeat protein [Candidatus Hydrogenedentes bacterium]|nr:PQQ-like beta-propeller repeat protein [Candidatus Hydrogenedentota bacterium]